MLDALLFQFPKRSKSTSSITKASVSYIKNTPYIIVANNIAT
jgi:hypothetical protein